MGGLVPNSSFLSQRETDLAESLATIQPMTYQVDRNPALVYLASLSTSSRRTMREALDRVAGLLGAGLTAESCPWGLLRYQHTQALRARLAEVYPAAATANRHIYAMRGVLKESWRLGYMSADDYQRAVDIKPIQGQKAKQAERGRALRTGELAALIDVCADGTAKGARDAAIFAIAYGAGLRRAEIVAIQLADYDEDKCQVTVRAGKGNKERIVPMNDGVCEAVGAWLDRRGPWAGALFTRVRRGDNVSTEGMTDQAIYDMMAERAGQAGVKEFSPHDMRRSFAGDLLDAGADIATVQKLMGHANANTTAGYDRRDARAKRDAINRLHVPYRRK